MKLFLLIFRSPYKYCNYSELFTKDACPPFVSLNCANLFKVMFLEFINTYLGLKSILNTRIFMLFKESPVATVLFFKRKTIPFYCKFYKWLSFIFTSIIAYIWINILTTVAFEVLDCTTCYGDLQYSNTIVIRVYKIWALLWFEYRCIFLYLQYVINN